MSIDRNGKTVLAILFGMAAGLYLLNQLLAGDAFGNQWVVIIVLAALTVGFGIWARQDNLQEKTTEDKAHESAAKAEAAARAAEAASQQAEAKAEARKKADEAVKTKAEAEARKKADEETKAEAEARKKADEAAKAKTATEAPKAAPAPVSEPDDLTRVEGIGPKYRDVLVAAGIDTFAKVAAAPVEDFRRIAGEAGMRNSASMTTWAEQAALAAKGDWDKLAALQEKLSGGRR